LARAYPTTGRLSKKVFEKAFHHHSSVAGECTGTIPQRPARLFPRAILLQWHLNRIRRPTRSGRNTPWDYRVCELPHARAPGVPLAAMGFISPIFCAAAMGCSDLIVIGNALRLLRWRV